MLLKEQLEEVDTLTPRRKVLRLRFGLDDGRSRTFRSRTRIWCNPERIQIEAKALRKLRHPSRSKAEGLFRVRVNSNFPVIFIKRLIDI